MKKKYIVKNSRDFEKIIKNSNISALKLIMKYYNSLGVNFGFKT